MQSARRTRGRSRRLTALVAVAALGLLALTGCRSDPQVAAYVGGTEITQAHLDSVFNGLYPSVSAELKASPEGQQRRASVLQLMVMRQVLDRYVAKHQIVVATPDLTAALQDTNIPRTSEFATVYTRFKADQDAIRAAVKPTPATEQQKREAYAQSVGFPETFAAAEPQLTDVEIAVRKAVVDAIADADVRMNPRYRAVWGQAIESATSQAGFFLPLGAPEVVKDAPRVLTAPDSPDSQG